MVRKITAILIAHMLLLASWAQADLSPDNLLLLVNQNVPQSRRLAEFYAKARLVPDGRILELPLPTGDEISFGSYEEEVIPAVRDFLKQNHLEQKVTCIVTFYGVPLRISAHKLTPAETEEVKELREEQGKLAEHVKQVVVNLERELRSANPGFVARTGDDPDHLSARAEAALEEYYRQVAAITDPAQRSARLKGLVDALHDLTGAVGVLRAFNPQNDASQSPEQKAKYAEAVTQARATVSEIERLALRRYDPVARSMARRLVAQRFGTLEQLRITHAHLEYLNPEASAAAFDNELALLNFPGYPRSRWQINPMHYSFTGHAQHPLMMVMRLDAPQDGMVRDMILTGLKAERDGLKGRVVLDSRGKDARGEAGKFGSYGWYDQSIRNLAILLGSKTKLSVLHDDSEAVLPPNSASNVALYCGWYSVRNYVPACKFNAGAVAFHVASYELVSLRAEGEKGWCKGLLDDGAAATLGAVGEPYLVAFPQADDFFPLLLTGKLPLAEVYWRTTPFASWMIAMIGDPLYVPYKVNPQMKVEDLPPRLKVVFEQPGH